MTNEKLVLVRQDFRLFLREVWIHHGLPEPTEVQYDIAHYLQHGPPDRGVMAQRGEGKTWITVCFLVWRLFRNPNERILLISETLGHAKKSLMLCRTWIDSISWLNYLQPKAGTKQRDGAEQFDAGPSRYDRMASVTALGVTGQITGNRASLIIPDDIESGENTLTPNARNLLIERIKEFENVRIPDSEVVVLGTYHHQESIYGRMESIGYKFVSWPARYPHPHECNENLAGLIARRLESKTHKPGDPTSPERFSDEYLLGRELKIGRAEFAMQYMLRTDLSDAEQHPLKLEDLIVYPCQRDHAPVTISWGKKDNFGSTALNNLPSVGYNDDQYYGPTHVSQERERFHGIKMVLDPAGGGRTTKDACAWSIIGQLHGNLFLKHVGGYTGPNDLHNLVRIVQAAKQHGAQEIWIETNYGGDMLVQLLRPLVARAAVESGDAQIPQGWTCSVNGYHQPSTAGHKEARIIASLDPILLGHRLIVDPSVAEHTEWARQLTRITAVRGSLDHDDYIESTAECVRQFIDVLDQDSEAAARALLEERADVGLSRGFSSWDDAEEERVRWVTY